MASLQQVFQGGFDANAVEPDQGRDFTLIEAGTLLDFEITGAEVKDAGSGNGCYLALETTIVGPTHASRKVWANITLKNTSAQAESIGQAQLSALCRAVGIANLTDTDQLFQKMFRGRVGIEKGRPKDKTKPTGERYADRNNIAAYEARGTASAPSPAAARPAANTAAVQHAAQVAAGGAKKAPWAK